MKNKDLLVYHGFPLLVILFPFIWVAIAGYILMTFMRVRRVESRLDGLEQELKRKDA